MKSWILAFTLVWGALCAVANAQESDTVPELLPANGESTETETIPPGDKILSPQQAKDLELYGPMPDLSDAPWFDPWMMRESWDISFELGFNGNKGNSDTFNIQSGLDLEQERDQVSNFIRFRYTNAYASGTETKNNMLLKLGHERQLGDSPWSLFVRSDLLYDRFKAFDMRWVLNGGVGYVFYENDVSMLKGRLGSGVSREFGGPNDAWSPEGVMGLDYKRQLTKRQKLSATIDYYPEWIDFSDYRLVTDASWEMLMDAEANLSLKLSVRDEYDSTPNGLRPNDLNYAFLLLWKF